MVAPRRLPQLLAAWAWLSCWPLTAVAKLQAGPLRISGYKQENHWKYLSKFGYGIGKGGFRVRLQLQQPKSMPADAKVELGVYLDEDWPAVEAMEDPCARSEKVRQKRDIMIPSQGNWSEWVSGSLSQNMRPHIWYFTISDCDDANTQRLQNFTHRLRFEFHATQEDGSEFSVEMRWMLIANFICLIGFSVFVWFFSKRTIAFNKSAGKVHPVIWTLAVGMFVQYVAQAFHTMHLWQYKYDGDGVKPLEVLSEILFMLAQVTQTSLLILIALGYTLLQSNIGELDLMIPLCFMVGVIHIMLVGFGKIKDDASYKYHENEGAVGWILLVMRLLLWVWFLWAVQSSASEGGRAMKAFLSQFRAAGTVYFLSYPAIFLITQFFAQYVQHTVMAIGLMCMQMGSNLYLASLFLTRGDYFKVSTLSSSDLPGGTKIGMVKEE